jgi:hypothetical protein
MLSLLMRGYKHDSKSKDLSQRQVLDSRAKRPKTGYPTETSDNGWIFLSKQDSREVFHTQESLFTKFGFGMFDDFKCEETRRRSTDRQL